MKCEIIKTPAEPNAYIATSLILECSQTGRTMRMALNRPMALADLFNTFKVALQRRRDDDRQLAATLCRGVCRIIY